VPTHRSLPSIQHLFVTPPVPVQGRGTATELLPAADDHVAILRIELDQPRLAPLVALSSQLLLNQATRNNPLAIRCGAALFRRSEDSGRRSIVPGSSQRGLSLLRPAGFEQTTSGLGTGRAGEPTAGKAIARPARERLRRSTDSRAEGTYSRLGGRVRSAIARPISVPTRARPRA
jgi:hypothetical protein